MESASVLIANRSFSFKISWLVYSGRVKSIAKWVCSQHIREKNILKKQVSAWGNIAFGSEAEEGLMSIRVCVRVNSWSSAGKRSCAHANRRNLRRSCCPNSCSVCHRNPICKASGDTPARRITQINTNCLNKFHVYYYRCIRYVFVIK